jgi:transposase
MSTAVKRRYFELIRTGWSGSQAAQKVGVSLSCGSLWFIDAGSVSYVETPISPRYLSQDDRIEIADGLARDEPVKAIAVRIGKSYQTVYREIARNRKPDGRYQPWYAHNQAHVRRRRPKPRRFAIDGALRDVVAGKLCRTWSAPLRWGIGRRVEAGCLASDQIAWASSVNAAAIRRAGGASSPSS